MDIKDRILHQFPEYIQNEYPLLIKFVEHYYQFLEASELKLSSITGTFEISEEILVAVTSKTAKVLGTDSDNSRLFISKQDRFEAGDIVSGLTSGATGTIVSITPNPLQSIEQLLAYRSIDTTVQKYFSNFKEEFLASIPTKLASGLDTRAITKNIVDLYRAKGTSEGHKLFFKMLLDEDIELYFPSEDLLSPSDGDWSFDSILRVARDSGSGIGDYTLIVGQELVQKNKPLSPAVNRASCNIDSIRRFYNGTQEVLELSLNKDSIRGDFVPGEYAYVTGTDSIEYNFILSPIVTSITIDSPGEYYIPVDPVKIKGFQYIASSNIETITSGYVSDIDIITSGSGYTGTEPLIFNEGASLGQGTDGIVSGIHGSIRLEDSSGELVQEGQTVFDSGIAEDKVLVEAGDGRVVDTRITRFGFNYDRFPLVTASTSGTEAQFIPKTVNIGSINSVRIIDPGFNLKYTDKTNCEANGGVWDPSAGTCAITPTATPNTVLVLTGITGQFIPDETITSNSGGSGSIHAWEDDIALLRILNVTGTFNIGDVVSGTTSGVTGTILRNSTASLSVNTGVIFNSFGRFISEDGFVSDFSKRIQDNYYYQNFSYLVKSAKSIATWRSAVKKAVHPAGFAVFGEIKLVSLLDGKMRVPTLDSTTFTPELFSTFKAVFGGVFRRRLGGDESSSKNPNPMTLGDGARDFSVDGDHDVGMSHEYLVEWIKPWENYTGYGGGRTGSTTYNLARYKYIDPPTTQGTTYYYDYLLVTGSAATQYDYASITDPGTQFHDYAGIVDIISEATTVAHDYPGIHRTGTTGIGTHNWLHPDTNHEGTPKGYTIDAWASVKISDISKNKRWNVPPPSEITLFVAGEWIKYSVPPPHTAEVFYYEFPVSSSTYGNVSYVSTGSATYTITSGQSYVVHIDGVIQPSSEYTVSGSTLTFGTGPVSGSIVEIREYSGAVNERVYVGSGITYAITSGLVQNRLIVYINNVIQKPIENFNVVASNIVLTSSLTSSDSVIILEFTDTFIRNSVVADGGTHLYPLSTSASTASSILTYVSGVYQMPTTNYTVY